MLFSALGYVIGSANSAIIITKLLYRKDIRFFGDGNAGTTNVLRKIWIQGN
jgi:glycerol-3-phosphate acyltransferase PlsY